MSFGNGNSQSEDPYALEIDDDDDGDCLTRQKRKHNSVVKQKKVLKNFNSHLSGDTCRSQEEHSFGSSWHLSQDFSPQINRRIAYKQNNKIQAPSEKSYRFFRSRNPFLLTGENLKSQINSKCASQEYSNVVCSSETYYLADTGNEEKEKSFTTQDNVSFLSNSFMKQNKANSLTATKAIVSPEEESIFSSICRKLPDSSIEETILALSEDHTLNLRSIRKFHCSQHFQKPLQIPKCVRFQKCKQQKETLAKPKKFFKTQDRNATSHNLEYFIRDNYAHQDRESFNLEKDIPENDYSTNNKLVGSNDPYSLETEDESYSNKLNKEFTYVNCENRCISQNRNRPRIEKSPLNGKSQSNYPYSFKMNGDNTATENKNFKCMAKQNGFKSSNAQFSMEVEHTMHRCMQSVNATNTEILHSPRKTYLVNSKIKALNQPLIGNITNQHEEENYLPIVHTRNNKTFQPTNESDEVLSLPKTSENVNLNPCDGEAHQVEINHLTPFLMHTGKDASPITATTSEKCSIAYHCLFKDTLSLVIHKRNNFMDSNAETICKENKEIYDTRLTSGNTNCKNKNISNKESCKLAHETNTKFLPVSTNLVKLKNHSNLTERKHCITDNNKESNLIPTTYTACNKTARVKSSLETKELCTPEINSTCLDVNDLESLKQTKSSSPCISVIKNLDTEMEISHSENARSHLIDELIISESTTNKVEDQFKKKTEDFQFSYSSQQKDFQKMMQRNTFTNGTENTNIYHNTTTLSSYEKHKMENHMKIKDNTKRENLIKLKVNTIPTNIKTTEKQSVCETECVAKQVVNAVNEKTCLSIMRKGSSSKNRIFTSKQRKKDRPFYRHKWVDDIGGDKYTKLISPTELLVQPISSDHELELRSPLPCVASKHIQTTEVTNKTEAVRNLKNNEIDKKHFTVIKKVRKSDQIQKLGELQDFNDDVEYILDSLQDSNPVTLRCHSAVILASKCLMPKFRMYVKANDAMTKFFCALHDAAEDQSLALCTATIMFVLSHYQIITYMNSSSIHLLLSLFNSCLKYEVESAQLQNIKKKVSEVCTEVQSHGCVKHLHPENITANQLASEALLNLTSCDTGYLLKDHLREMGGLEHIITAINNCVTEINDFFIQWREDLTYKLRFLNSCLQILECFTDQNEENQIYLLKYESNCFMGTMAALLSKCTEEIKTAHQFNSTASVVTLELLFTILKVLINLTHSNNDTSFGSSLVARRPEMIYVSLYVLLQAPSYVPEEKKFDLLAMVLMFLINAVEHNTDNRKLIFEAKASDIKIHRSKYKHIMKLLIELFYKQQKHARIEEFYTNAMLDSQIDSELSHEPLEPSQEFVASLQERAGQNMKYTMIASYLVLLMGYLIVDNEEYEIYVRQCLPQRCFSPMISVLEKMHNFFNTVPVVSSEKDVTQMQYIIQYLKQSDEKATVITSNKYQL